MLGKLSLVPRDIAKLYCLLFASLPSSISFQFKGENESLKSSLAKLTETVERQQQGKRLNKKHPYRMIITNSTTVIVMQHNAINMKDNELRSAKEEISSLSNKLSGYYAPNPMQMIRACTPV